MTIPARAACALVVLVGAAAARAQELPSFGPMVTAAAPAVVNVTTLARPTPRGGERDTMEDLLRRFFEEPVPRGGLGSGFVVSPEGEIATNAHVVDGADGVRVQFSTGETLDARIVGVDEKTDVALLRVDAGRPLPALPIGDSKALGVGDWVVAIGNPFGLQSTATAGIVSAKDRFIGAGPYDDFIQTDAAINPGNSGGPLLDTRGRVVGINTAIVSPGGGNVGIGFAIPMELASWVLDQLREHGRVTRGMIGIGVQPVTPELARAFSLERARGALVAQVEPRSAAAAAGIRRGDVIVAWNGAPIERSQELPARVASTTPGTTVRATLLRDGAERAVRVTVREMPAEERPRPRRQGRQ